MAKLTPEQQQKIRKCVDDMIEKGSNLPKARMFAICTASVMKTKENLLEAKLSTKTRKSLSASQFAVPGKRKLPIHDAAHVRNALARFNQVQGLTPEEKRIALRRILAAAKKFGIKVTAKRFQKKTEEATHQGECPEGQHMVDGKCVPIKKETKEEQQVEILENQPINITESFSLIETKEGDDPSSQEIRFTALKSGISGNNRRYSLEEIQKQNLKGMKIFMDHDHTASNVVGKIKESVLEGHKLQASGIIKNSHRNPDVVEMVRDGRIDEVSIGGHATIRRVKEKDKIVDHVENLQVKEVSFVGIGGVTGAKVNSIGG